PPVPAPDARASAPGASSPAAGGADAPTADDVAALLRRRGQALVAGAGALSEVVGTPEDLDRLRRSDARAAVAGVAAWAADVTGLTPGGAPGVDHVADLLLRVRVVGEDREVVSRARTGVTRQGGRWVLTPVADAGTPQPWDLGDVEARTGPRGVVLRIAGGDPAAADPAVVETAGLAAELAADLADAARRVDAAWGTDWPRATAVVVPATAADAARLAGVAPEAVEALDALAVGVEADLPDGLPAGVRVVVQPARFPGLTPLGRRITLTHELVHVATRAGTSVRTAGALPRWLVEGYADFAARAGRDLDATALARPLLDAVAAGRPVLVPDDAAFGAADPTELQIAYAAAWTLVTSVARRTAAEAVTGLYRGLAAAPERGGLPAAPPAQRLDEGCYRAFGETFDDVRRRWVADVTGGLDGWS
ncbi:hypothetical protein GTR02_18355, partial [Kineococcus sp. R8]|uniref:hypothetical protein n=1 Tax=Kineococcus siccus TaxID=2696567 RepID=UPI0014121423